MEVELDLVHQHDALGVTRGAMDALVARLFDVLEGRLGSGPTPPPRPVSVLADLVLRLRDARFEIVNEGVRRPVATATLAYCPPGAAEAEIESPVFTVAAPLGAVETGDLAYYLERYHLTPFGIFAERAKAIEDRFPEWGEDRWDALQPDVAEHAAVIAAWKRGPATAQRRFTVEARPLPPRPRKADDEEKRARAEQQEAATALLALPWELLHDRVGYLFQGGLGVRVRRSLPGDEPVAELAPEMFAAPLRVLVVCARPEEDGVGYIDHRVSVRPLTEALNALGDLACYDVPVPPTFPALCDRLRGALCEGKPYHIVHFDGHGVYDRFHGLGGLVFEHPKGAREGKLRGRRSEVITADRLGAELRNAGVRLFFLEACQSARSEETPEASVAGRLLRAGVASVVAMSHSVLVETARCSTKEFYPALVRGERVGEAMLAGQRGLFDQKRRGWAWEPKKDGSGQVARRPLELDDWFVPVLYQDAEDPALLTESPPAARVREEIERGRSLALGDLPAPPEHSFVGRSRELLAAERLLVEQGER